MIFMAKMQVVYKIYLHIYEYHTFDKNVMIYK